MEGGRTARSRAAAVRFVKAGSLPFLLVEIATPTPVNAQGHRSAQSPVSRARQMMRLGDLHDVVLRPAVCDI